MSSLKTAGNFTLLCIASLTIMVGTLLAPGLVTIADGLGIQSNSVLLITLPSLGAVVFAPLAGRLIDKYGAYPLLIIGLFLYGLVGACAYFLHGPTLVFINRFALGGITAIVMASCTVLISTWYSGEARLNMIAKQGMAIELGGVIFLFLGGVLASMYWGLPLALYLIAWVFLAMLLMFVPRKQKLNAQNTEQTQQIKKSNSNALTLKGVYIVSTLAMTIFFTSTVLLPFTLHALNFNESEIGQLLAFISLIAVFTAGFMPKATKRLSEKNVLAIAFFAFGLSYLCFIQSSTLILVLGALLIGIGFGFSIPLLNHMTVELSPENVRGRNLSYFTMAVFSGQFFTSFMEYIPGGEHNVFIICSILSAVVAIALLVKPKAH
ncbi:MFS transporter [Pseudoalteromonas sp. S327]|uniref:MFS transporter n=1 Tax=Pseudoalteromonas TaxID=53246 RepID=UPI00110BC1C3|nr:MULTISPECIES: MFS transporter [unclassified Pseudoalteromonas]TMO08480.1 MFS transporter [Pseudoalteromonas sp. S327]TMO20300.1 MFS transporter [Pseudoalteromonas sp. S326]